MKLVERILKFLGKVGSIEPWLEAEFKKLAENQDIDNISRGAAIVGLAIVLLMACCLMFFMFTALATLDGTEEISFLLQGTM